MSMIEFEVIASGATAAASASFALDATIGQPIVGHVAGIAHVCQGFWCDFTPQSIVETAFSILYRLTFGQIGISVALMAGVILQASHTVCDWTMQLWAQRHSH